MSAMQSEIEGYQGTYDQLEHINQRAQEKLIFDNPLTDITIEALRGLYNALKNRVSSQKNEFNNQILSRDATNITEDQMRDYEASFKHFDKNNNGRLDRLEFRGVLLSLGFPIPQIPQEGKDQEFDSIWRRVDVDNEGTVSLQEFVAFMAEEAAGAESANDLLDAFKALANGQAYVLATDLQRELSPELYEYCMQHMAPYPSGPEGALDYQSFATALYGESEL
jgi:Ca2+-binding EF-hand superfamily protein